VLAAQSPAPDTVGCLPRHAVLGVALAPDSTAPNGGGVVVQAMTPTGTAAAAGVKVGDRVLALNDTAVSDVATFVARSGRLLAGRPVALRVRRGSDTLTLRARAVARPLEAATGLTVDYGSVDASGARRRTITVRPAATGRHPGVLIMGGVGCYSLDGLREQSGGYGALVYGLARAGYAVMRVEKVGEGDSEGPSCESPAADLRLEVAGLVAGLRALRADPRVDSAQVAIVAHSMGPIEAALVADSMEADSRYLVDMINDFHPGRASLRVIDGMDHGLESAPPPREAIRSPRDTPGEAHPLLLPTVRAWLDATRAATPARQT
jgi:hypothetical protein